MKLTLIAHISSTLDAMNTCAKRRDAGRDPDAEKWLAEWWRYRLTQLENLLPSGAGIDNGTKIDIDKSTPEAIILNVSYHHMNEGSYVGWTDYTLRCTPSFLHSVYITFPRGRDRFYMKEYLQDVYHEALMVVYDSTIDGYEEVK